jgi:hypothetical protein
MKVGFFFSLECFSEMQNRVEVIEDEDVARSVPASGAKSCACCKKQDPALKRCGKCKQVSYCSIDCQVGENSVGFGFLLFPGRRKNTFQNTRSCAPRSQLPLKNCGPNTRRD